MLNKAFLLGFFPFTREGGGGQQSKEGETEGAGGGFSVELLEMMGGGQSGGCRGETYRPE